MTELPIVENCDGCGACCSVVPVPPFVMQNGTHEAVTIGVPEELLQEVLAVWDLRLYLPPDFCMWFDVERKVCRHYEYRPQACRNFELNSPACHATREMMHIDGPS
ncbi:YkgJ family cysteine cluster protein [Thalassoglobus sp. JC818]|uniref:YkgJ family cysteine cluster protein n=1 Tax=Thalassoglobus sp. JC818 TaxID=3232136 RepID=UPI003458EBE9